MAKENLNTKPKGKAPFRKFEQLAKRLIAVPKGAIAKPKGKQ